MSALKIRCSCTKDARFVVISLAKTFEEVHTEYFRKGQLCKVQAICSESGKDWTTVDSALWTSPVDTITLDFTVTQLRFECTIYRKYCRLAYTKHFGV